jgi:multidrug efflux pump subunit AcrA (membrane-fusion protein)
MDDIRLYKPTRLTPRYLARFAVVLCFLLLASLLSACEVSTPTETPPVVVEDYTALVSVTGKVTPAAWTTVGTQTSGMVVEVLVEEGDPVAEGDVLVRLDATDAQLAIKQAQAALAAAEAQVARVKVGTQPGDIAVVEAQIAAAQTVVSQTLAQRNQLWTGASEAEIAAAEAAVAAAQAEQFVARQRHDDTMKCYDVPNSTEKSCPLLGTMEEQARFALHAANEALVAAEAQVEALRSGAWAQRRSADSGVDAATAQVDIALAQLEALKAGPLAEDIAIAEAAVAQAKVALEAATVALARAEIVAPFAGTVTSVDVQRGEFIVPGQMLITLGDLSTLRIETTDLDEIDVARITVGQETVLTFDALPDRTFTGRVARIAPMAESSTGGVHYTVILEPEGLDPQVRWGMTVFVDIDVNQ